MYEKGHSGIFGSYLIDGEKPWPWDQLLVHGLGTFAVLESWKVTTWSARAVISGLFRRYYANFESVTVRYFSCCFRNLVIFQVPGSFKVDFQKQIIPEFLGLSSTVATNCIFGNYTCFRVILVNKSDCSLLPFRLCLGASSFNVPFRLPTVWMQHVVAHVAILEFLGVSYVRVEVCQSVLALQLVPLCYALLTCHLPVC